MGKILFVMEEKRESKYWTSCEKRLITEGHKVKKIYYRDDTVISLICQNDYDLVVVENLLGYDIPTLTGDVCLNFAYGKVYNLITRESCENENRLRGLISISHFFECTNHSMSEKLHGVYPHVNNIGCIDGWGEDDNTNGALFAGSICKVLKICHIH